MQRNRKQLRWAGLRVGVIITLALLIVLLAIIFAGNIGKIFGKKDIVYAVFGDVKGLREGAPIWFSGIEIGYVESLSFLESQKIKVALAISPDSLGFLRKDSTASIHTLGLLGDKYLELSSGTPHTDLLLPGDTIKGMLESEFKDFIKTTEESVKSLTDFIDMLESVLTKIEQGEGTVPMLLRDPEVYSGLKRTSKSLDTFSERLVTSKGTLNKLIEDERLYDNMSDASLKFDQALDNVNSVSQKLNMLLHHIDKGEGTLGKLVKEDDLADELKLTLNELNALIRDMKEDPKKYFKFSIF